MRALRGIGVVGVLLAVALMNVSPASAATEVGNTCTADIGHENATELQLAKAPGDTAPITVPAAGVVTAWTTRLVSTETVTLQRMRVFRATGNSNEFTNVAETPYEVVSQGVHTFETRISVQAGDRFGAWGPFGSLTCTTSNPADSLGTFSGDATEGSTHTFSASSGEQVAISAVVEPDVDGDGYGDETQDKCPQKATLQTPCPTITLEAFPIALKRSVLVLVSASSETSVQVLGQVSWKPRHRGGALASKTRKPGDHKSTGVIVGLSGGTQTVSPGQVARFNVKLPKSVKRQLRQIPPGKSLRGTITARTTDLAGRVTDRVINIHLKGQQTTGR
jgi:hypothetical protein